MTVAPANASSEIEVESARASGREHADNRLCRVQDTNDQKAKERQLSRGSILKTDRSLKKKSDRRKLVGAGTKKRPNGERRE